MNAKSFQSQSAALLLAGFVLAVLGGWGTYYFGSKSTEEKEQQWALKEQQLTDKIASMQTAEASPSPGPDSDNSFPSPEDKQHPVDALATGASQTGTPAPAPHGTPALITSESGSSPPHIATPASPANTGWSLSDKQHQKIVDVLSKYAGKNITICSVESDAQGLAFAGTLKRLFVEAGWRVDEVKQVSYAKPPVGLNLATGSFPLPEGLIATYRAFTSAGFNVSQQLDAKLTGGQAELIVGAMQ